LGFPGLELADQEVIMSQERLDIPYASQSPTQVLDFFLPDRGSRPYPVVAWFHPGGYSMGDKGMMMDLLLPPLLASGYAVVGVNYRLTGEALYPAQILDAKAAIRWIRATASQYHCNTEKIASWGCSAGATLAALLGTSAQVKELEDLTMGNPTTSSRVCAVVDWYGPIDMLQMDTQLIELGYKAVHNTADSEMSRLFGGLMTGFPEKCQAMNPIRYITPEAPPFYIQHGKSDDLVPYLQSVRLAEALRAVMAPEKVVLEMIERAGHFSGIHQSTENINKILVFLNRYLK